MTDHPCHKCPNKCKNKACELFYNTLLAIDTDQEPVGERVPKDYYFRLSFPDDPINKTQTELKL